MAILTILLPLNTLCIVNDTKPSIPIERRWDFWIALITLSLALLVAGRIWVTEWTAHLQIIVYLAFLASLAGFALGYSRFSPVIAALIGVFYGAFISVFLLGTTINEPITWYDRILNVVFPRLAAAVQQFWTGNRVLDPILFLMLLAFLMWVIVSISAFMIIRQGTPWITLLPLALTMLIISHYDANLARNTRFLMSFLFLGLLLVGRSHLMDNRRQWWREGIHITRETQADWSRTLLLVVAALVVLSWLIPVSPPEIRRYADLWKIVSEPWSQVQNRFADLFTAENPTATLSSTYFGETLNLGVGTPLSDATTMTVTVMDPLPTRNRYYWRARSYDQYIDGQWSNSPNLADSRLIPKDALLPNQSLETHPIVRVSFTNAMARMINVYTTGQPVTVDYPVEALSQQVGTETYELLALIAEPNLAEGESYVVTARLPNPTVRDLRASPDDTAAWLQPYLQLPPNFSEEIRALAEKITAGERTPYDKTIAITQYLRENITYSRVMAPVPEGSDMLAWFLLEEKQGFCNYYASAQILMLRSLGIPARLSVGYAQGEFDPDTGTYTVRKADSHAWPEVHFEGVGWVIFEPTVSQRAITFPTGTAAADGATSPADDSNPSPNEGRRSDLPENLPGDIAQDTGVEPLPDESSAPTTETSRAVIPLTLLGVLLIVLILAVLIFVYPHWFKLEITPLPVLLERRLTRRQIAVPAWLRRWSRTSQLSATQRAYRQLQQTLTLLGKAPQKSQTAAETAADLIALLPEAEPAIQTVLLQYQLDQFSTAIVSEERARQAAHVVRRYGVNAWFRQVLSHFKFSKKA